MTESEPDWLRLDAAVERIMEAKGVSRRTAKRWLLKALQKGELTAYAFLKPPPEEIN